MVIFAHEAIAMVIGHARMEIKVTAQADRKLGVNSSIAGAGQLKLGGAELVIKVFVVYTVMPDEWIQIPVGRK